jgi:hypothetical protein
MAPALTLNVLGVTHEIRDEALDVLKKEYIAVRKYHARLTYNHWSWMQSIVGRIREVLRLMSHWRLNMSVKLTCSFTRRKDDAFRRMRAVHRIAVHLGTQRGGVPFAPSRRTQVYDVTIDRVRLSYTRQATGGLLCIEGHLADFDWRGTQFDWPGAV